MQTQFGWGGGGIELAGALNRALAKLYSIFE